MLKLYLKGQSSYASEKENILVKKELKQHYKVDTRRKDDFIHAGLLGALRLRDACEIKENDMLYLTSGVGNFNIVKTIHESMIVNDEIMKIFDFINMLGNTTSFYVAHELKIKSKAVFQISDTFNYFHSLISIYASLFTCKSEAILGVIDIMSEEPNSIKRLLGVDEDTSIASSVSYQKLSLTQEGAIAEIGFDTKFYSLDEVQELIKKENFLVVCSSRCTELRYEKPELFFENYAALVIREAVENKKDTLFIECHEKKYKILKVRNLV